MNQLLAISGYLIGYIAEGVIAVILLIAVIVTAKKRKAARAENAAEPSEEAETLPPAESPATDETAVSATEPETSNEMPIPEPETGVGTETETPAAAEDTDGTQAEADGAPKTTFEAKQVSFDEAYKSLSREQLGFFNHIKQYALEKPETEEKRMKNCVCIKSSKKQLLKLTIKRGITVAMFQLENDLLKNYRRNAETSVEIKVKATEVPVYDVEAMYTACRMVDLMLEQLEKERQEAEERKRNSRKAKKDQN